MIFILIRTRCVVVFCSSKLSNEVVKFETALSLCRELRWSTSEIDFLLKGSNSTNKLGQHLKKLYFETVGSSI